MAVLIGHASIDERGKANSGLAATGADQVVKQLKQ